MFDFFSTTKNIFIQKYSVEVDKILSKHQENDIIPNSKEALFDDKDKKIDEE